MYITSKWTLYAHLMDGNCISWYRYECEWISIGTIPSQASCSGQQGRFSVLAAVYAPVHPLVADDDTPK